MPTVPRNSARTDKIIEAAGKLFSRQGYHGTTTRQIAHLAGVGENTLFRQFEHKEELFWSTLRYYSAALKPRRDLLEGLEQCDPPEVVLPKIFGLLTDTASYKPELLQLIAVAFLELHWNVEVFGSEYLTPVLSQINQYLDTKIKDGKLRGLDPTILTSALMMTTLMHPEISKLIKSNKPSKRSNPKASRAYANFWLDLLAPKEQTRVTAIKSTPLQAARSQLRMNADVANSTQESKLLRSGERNA
jgi:AcrR family transcriptional regulator